MNAVAKYLASKKKALLTTYRKDEEVKCGLVAAEIARLLMDQGKSPYVMEFQEEENCGNGITATTLVSPRGFLRGLSWDRRMTRSWEKLFLLKSIRAECSEET